MTTDQAKAHVRDVFEDVWNRHDPAAVDDLFAPHFHMERPLPGVESTRQGLKDWVRTTCRAFPDIEFTVNEQLGEDNVVVSRWSTRGTHRDTFMGIPATGRQIEIDGVSIARFENGELVADNVVWDALGMMQQLGVAPEMAAHA